MDNIRLPRRVFRMPRCHPHLRNCRCDRRRRQRAHDNVSGADILVVLKVDAPVDCDQAQLDAMLQLRAAHIRQPC